MKSLAFINGTFEEVKVGWLQKGDGLTQIQRGRTCRLQTAPCICRQPNVRRPSPNSCGNHAGNLELPEKVSKR